MKTQWSGTLDEFAAFAERAGLPPVLPIGVLGALVADLDLHLWRDESGRINLTVDEVTELP